MMKAVLLATMLSGVVLTPAFALETPQSKKDMAATQTQTTQKVNLNKADVPTLIQSFKGIGKKRAQAIVSYRELHGRFKSVTELGEVPGIGKQFASKHLTELQQTFTTE